MKPVSGPFVVHSDEDAVEVTARGAGAAGAVGVEMFGGTVFVDLDGADVTSLVSVRFPKEKDLSETQHSFVKDLFGEQTDDILRASAGSRDVRVGPARGAARSNDQVEVDSAFSLFVVGADALQRNRFTAPVEALLALETLVAAEICGLAIDGDLRKRYLQMIEHLPVKFPVPGCEAAYRESLSRAVECGVLLGVPSMLDDSQLVDSSDVRLLEKFAFHSRVLHESAPPSVSKPALLGKTVEYVTGKAVETEIVVDPLSLCAGIPVYLWEGENTLLVSVPAAGADETLWARLRSSDGTIIAASPLLEEGSNAVLKARLLAVPRDGMVLDVVPSVSSRVLDQRVSALAHAVRCGQRAGRLERLGALDVASRTWEECAGWHRVVGDAPREKLAIMRSESPVGGAPTLLDSLLENRPPS